MPADMKNIIAHTLLDLMQQKSLDKITVKSLIDTCGISRQTFYIYFTDKFELLQTIYKEEFDEAVKHAKDTSLTYGDVWYRLLMRRRKFYLHAFDVHGYCSLSSFLVDLHHKRATEIIRKTGLVLNEKQRIRLRIFNYGSVYMLQELLKKGTNLTGDELDAIFLDAAPDFLQRAWGFYTHAELNLDT